ncbi:MAG TPA: hypothetical protein VLK33_17380 [Terriglobales bacterium]|nr:hypothetical protein [Terriglobales bacterium]
MHRSTQKSVKFVATLAALFVALAIPSLAQTCVTSDEMDAATKSALTSTGQRYFGYVGQGDVASLRQNAIPGLASNFGGIEAAVTENKANLAGVTPSPRLPYELKLEGTAPSARAEFLCGVFRADGQTPTSAVFAIPNLPPGTYAMIVLDASTAKGPYTVSFVLQQDGTSWRFAGFYVKAAQAAGHDGQWFVTKAREFKTKGQMRNAWLYAAQAREMLVPVPFMSTMVTDKLYDEFQSVKPADMPPPDIAAAGKTYKVNSLYLLPLNNELYLILKYASPDVSNNTQTFQDTQSVMKALVAKYPEFRDAFDAVVVRAVEPSGRDFGSQLPMKDIK